MTAYRGTAQGKVILFGEHAVVYGIPALAVGIDRGASATAAPLAADPRSGVAPASTLLLADWGVAVSDASADESVPLGRALRDLLAVTRDAQREQRTEAPCAFAVEARTELPPGAGLGCSAALGVAVARAIDPGASASVIAARVTAWERVFHGNPSGVDAAVASTGGCVLFQRDPDAASPASMKRVRVPASFHLCVGHSGVGSSTKSMVESVARLRERRPEVTQRTFDAIHTLVKNARLALEDGDAKAVGQLLDLNQMLLSGLFVSTSEIEQMCATARTAGALGAKLTGAGGGGCVVALVENAARGEDVLAAWKAEGFDGFATTIGGEAKAAHSEPRLDPGSWGSVTGAAAMGGADSP